MNRSDTGEVKCPMPTVTGQLKSSRINRHQGPSCFSGLASLISTFLVGLVSGAAGGLLLGATAVVMLQSLELLDENKLLMEKLKNYVTDHRTHILEAKITNLSKRTCNDQVINFDISVFVGEFGVLSSSLSLAVGVCAGLSVYSLVIKRHSEAVMGKAVGLAGTVCLMGVTVCGSVMGLTLEGFLSFASSDFVPWFIFPTYHSALILLLIVICRQETYENVFFMYVFSVMLLSCIDLILTPGVSYFLVLVFFFFKTKLVLVAVLIPTTCGLYQLKNTFDSQLPIVTPALMLIVTEVFNIVNQPIVVLHSPSPTNTIGAVHEGIFVGLLTSLLFTAAVGMSVFASWQRGEAGRTCVGAAGCGAAVLAAVKVALPVLGPGPTVGALMGVAGAVGVSFSAAGAATDHCGQVVDYCGLIGRLGVTVGAAAGGLLSSFSHSGLSGMFMGLCTAVIPAGLYVKLLLLFVYRHRVWQNLKVFWLFSCLIVFTVLVWFLTWFQFACIDEHLSYMFVKSILYLLLNCAFLLMLTLNLCK